MIPVTSRWKDLDNAWSNKFITGAGKLGEDLSRKVNQERVRYAKNFEEYWTDAINECKIKEDILVYEAEEARIQDELSRLRHKLSEIQEKVKMQNSSNREMDEDSVNEDPVHDEQISKLIAENTEIKKKYAEVEAENAKLKEIIKQSTRRGAEYEARIRKLEQSDKEKAENWFYGRKYNDGELQTYIPEIVTDTEDAWVRTTLRIKDLKTKKGGGL
ncbi:16694_t:CDS:2 [Entrophospora sp. SA101]|nr:16694_t:CDS:2 [Entrophospora sp. SA101]